MSRRAPMLVAAALAAAVPAFAQTPPLPAITSPPPSIPYTWKSVVIRAGGFVSGIVFSPSQRGLVYARTDVGGAYRSEDSGQHWTALSDNFSRDEATYMGIESLALDPTDPSKLYLAAGMYSADWGGPSAIFRSTDRGRTFLRAPMPFRMGGNDNGRGCGERLAVDPRSPNILYFGSRKAGLWRSTDFAATWSHVDTFPAPDKLTGPGENTGITFIVFDQTGPHTQTIYAGVAQPGASLYRSSDSGQTWTLIENTPANLFPSHAVVAPTHTLALTFNDNPGPGGITNGAVFQFTPATSTWTDISPVHPGAPGQKKFGFGALSLDPQHPATLVVTTIDRWNPTDTLYRTTDSGAHWRDLGPAAQSSAPDTPWVYWHRDKTGGRGWMSSLQIDPFDPAHVLYATGEGIWGSSDLTRADSNSSTHWTFPNEGIEEAVPSSLISPPIGAHLFSAIGDIGGFRHEDLARSPKDGFLVDPWLISASSLDFAALAPAIIVRVGYGDAKIPRGGYTLDSGDHWRPFASEPPASKKGGGHIAISADGRTLIWSPDHATPSWSTDWGKTWTLCASLTDQMRVVADRVNPARFYSFNSETGQLLESADSAKTFSVRTIPVASKGRSALLAPTPGLEGDLWIAASDKLFHTTDLGDTFIVLEGFAKVYKLGFGAPAPNSPYPTLYINGIAAGQEGLYRSTDSARTWLRIDDPAHQYGWKNDITGDPRIFGRVYLATGGRGILYADPAQSPPNPPSFTPEVRHSERSEESPH